MADEQDAGWTIETTTSEPAAAPVEAPVLVAGTPVSPVVPDEPEPPAEAPVEAKSSYQKRKQERNSFQSRIDTITREREDAKREAAEWRARAERPGAAPPVASSASPAPPSPGKPTIDQFASADDPLAAWTEAMADWKVEQRLSARDAHSQLSRSVETFQSSRPEFVKAHPDYEAVIQRPEVLAVQLSEHHQRAILAAQSGHALVYHLAQHPEVLTQFASSHTPGEWVKAMDAVLGTLRTTDATPGPSAAAPVSRAPSPIKPVGASTVASASDPSDLDFGPEYVKAMNKREREASVR